MQNLKIAIPPELFAPAESSSFEGYYALPEFHAGPDTYRFEDPLRYDVRITNTTGAFLVTGTVRGVGTTECARCLDDIQVPVSGSVEGYFISADAGGEAESADEELEGEDEAEFDFLGPDNVIDLEPLLQAAILVELPLQPLCRPDCRGICQDCGINLNEGTCDCAQKRAAREAAQEAASNPFAVLAQLEFSEEEMAAARREAAQAPLAEGAGGMEAAFGFREETWGAGPGDIPDPPEPDFEGGDQP